MWKSLIVFAIVISIAVYFLTRKNCNIENCKTIKDCACSECNLNYYGPKCIKCSDNEIWDGNKCICMSGYSGSPCKKTAIQLKIAKRWI